MNHNKPHTAPATMRAKIDLAVISPDENIEKDMATIMATPKTIEDFSLSVMPQRKLELN